MTLAELCKINKGYYPDVVFPDGKGITGFDYDTQWSLLSEEEAFEKYKNNKVLSIECWECCVLHVVIEKEDEDDNEDGYEENREICDEYQNTDAPYFAMTGEPWDV